MHNLLLVYFVNRYMFRPYLCPSSGGTTVWIQQLVLIILFRWLSVVLVALEFQSEFKSNHQDNSHLKRIVRTNCCIHRLYLLMMDLDTAETCRFWRNILRISCASSWFFFTQVRKGTQSVTILAVLCVSCKRYGFLYRRYFAYNKFRFSVHRQCQTHSVPEKFSTVRSYWGTRWRS